MKLCLDAGHSGKTNPYLYDGQTIGYESTMAWSLCEKLRRRLTAAGAEVLVTRSTIDEDPELLTRGKMAAGCDLFLSLHSNAGSISADYPLACTQVDGSSDEIGMKLAKTAAKVMGTTQPARIWKRDYLTGAGKMLLSETDADFGKRTAANDYYGVLRGAAAMDVPGVLLECSFHTHPQMVQWLTDEANLERLAAALCDTITGHFGVIVPDWETKYTDLRAKYDDLIGELKKLQEKYQGDENDDGKTE